MIRSARLLYPLLPGDNVEGVHSADLKPYRKAFTHPYSVGTRPVLELLARRPGDALAVMVHPKGARSRGVAEAKSLATSADIPVHHFERLVASLSRKDNVFVVAAFRKYREALSARRDHLVLVQPADFGNLGTIVRTALGFGLEDIALIGPSADDFHPKVVRASMGSRFSVRVERFERFERYLECYPRTCYPFVSEAGTPLPETHFAAPWALVFGPEGGGLSPDIVAAGSPVTIPQQPHIDSFNLSVAVAVALYEADRA